MAQAFDEVADDYDVVVIDCPPQLGFLTQRVVCCNINGNHRTSSDAGYRFHEPVSPHDTRPSGCRERGGGNLQYDFIRYLLTRYEPQDAPQTKVTALLRNMFEDHVLTNPMVKSAAVSDAGLTKQTLYEIGRENLTRSTYDRAMESLDAVNSEIEALIKMAWGGSNERLCVPHRSVGSSQQTGVDSPPGHGALEKPG